MTGVRQSIAFQIEEKFGEGCPYITDMDTGALKKCWVAAPPGSFLSSTHRRDVKRVQTTGSKFWDTVAYGPLSGSWEWTFYLDYRYPEPLFLIFEGGDTTNVKYSNKLEFTKVDGKRIPSFCIRRKILNDFISGGDNECTILKGCVVTNATLSRQANSSYTQVRLSGFYTSEELEILTEEQMNETDYVEYDGKLVEYGCLTSGKLSGDDASNSTLIENTDSVTISIDNSAEAIFSTCAPFATNYAEGLSKITFSASSYANHPLYYQTGVMTGGKDFNLRDPSLIEVLMEQGMQPNAKGLRPLADAYLTSYDAMARNTDGIIGRAYAGSDSSSEIHLREVVMSSLVRQKGDSGKLMDALNNCPVKTIVLTLKSDELPYFILSGPPTADTWKDMFYSVADLDEHGNKTRVNNVFEEFVESFLDDNGIRYSLIEDEDFGMTGVVESAPAGLSGDIVLLSELTSIKTGRTYPVTKIESRAFQNNDGNNGTEADRPVSITSIEIPESVICIEEFAFRYIDTLESVIGGVPSETEDGGVKTIEAYAFDGCSALTSCDLLAEGTNVREIGVSAFNGVALSEIYLRPDVEVNVSRSDDYEEFRDYGAFANNPSLTKVTLPINLCVIKYDLASNVYEDAMFYGCDNIEEFVFNQNPDIAFTDFKDMYDNVHEYDGDGGRVPAPKAYTVTPWCRNLYYGPDPESVSTKAVSISWTEDVTSIPDNMFRLDEDVSQQGAVSYTMQVESMAGIVNIGSYAFHDSGLESTYVEEDGVRTLRLDGVRYIDEGCFSNLLWAEKIAISSSIRSLVLPSNLLSFDWEGVNPALRIIDLSGCTGSNVTAKGGKGVSGVFQGVVNLEKVIFPPNIQKWYKNTICMAGDNEGYIRFRYWNPAEHRYYDVAYKSLTLEVSSYTPLRKTVYYDVGDGNLTDIPRAYIKMSATESGYYAVFGEGNPEDMTWEDLDGKVWNTLNGVVWGWLGRGIEEHEVLMNQTLSPLPFPNIRPGTGTFNPGVANPNVVDDGGVTHSSTPDEPYEPLGSEDDMDVDVPADWNFKSAGDPYFKSDDDMESEEEPDDQTSGEMSLD